MWGEIRDSVLLDFQVISGLALPGSCKSCESPADRVVPASLIRGCTGWILRVFLPTFLVAARTLCFPIRGPHLGVGGRA